MKLRRPPLVQHCTNNTEHKNISIVQRAEYRLKLPTFQLLNKISLQFVVRLDMTEHIWDAYIRSRYHCCYLQKLVEVLLGVTASRCCLVLTCVIPLGYVVFPDWFCTRLPIRRCCLLLSELLVQGARQKYP